MLVYINWIYSKYSVLQHRLGVWYKGWVCPIPAMITNQHLQPIQLLSRSHKPLVLIQSTPKHFTRSQNMKNWRFGGWGKVGYPHIQDFETKPLERSWAAPCFEYLASLSSIQFAKAHMLWLDLQAAWNIHYPRCIVRPQRLIWAIRSSLDVSHMLFKMFHNLTGPSKSQEAILGVGQ